MPVIPIACASAVERAGCRSREHELRDAVGRAARPRRGAGGRARHVEREPGDRRHDADACRGVDGEARVLRRVVEAALEPREVAIGGGAAERELVELRRSAGASIVASRQRGMRRRVGPATTVTGAAITASAARCAPASESTVTDGGSLTHGQRDGRARERRERATISAARAAVAVEHAPGRARGDRDVQAAADEPRLAVRRVDRSASRPSS